MAARRVLFAIRNPEAARQPGLAKAIQVARALGASLELFHAICDPLFIEYARLGDDSVDKLRERIETEARMPLLRLCEKALRHGVEVSSRVEWDYPPHEAVVRRAQAIKADLIIAECHKGARTRAWLIHLTDWELLRNSPVPVLLIRNGKPYRRPLVLAAIDPAHAHAKPSQLDDRILAESSQLVSGLRGKLHVMHANYPSIVGLVPAASRSWSTLNFEQLQKQEKAAFEKFRTAAKIPRTRAHLVDGNPVVEIPKLANTLSADIVAMGALSRSGLQRLLIGNTAERLLGTLDCDVLVVKPESFTARVTSNTRGIRVLAPTTMLAS